MQVETETKTYIIWSAISSVEIFLFTCMALFSRVITNNFYILDNLLEIQTEIGFFNSKDICCAQSLTKKQDS